MFDQLQQLRLWRNSSATKKAIPLGVVLTVLVWSSAASAQTAATGEHSIEERLKRVEHERDALKARNLELEDRLRQLQTTVDRLVSDAMQSGQLTRTSGLSSSSGPPEAHPPEDKGTGATQSGSSPAASGWPPTAASGPSISPVDALARRPFRPYYAPYGPFTSPLQAPADLVQLAVAYQDALSERRAESEKGSKKYWPNFSPAERKVRLLRSMTKMIRDLVADEVERVRKLAAVHGIPAMDTRNMETRLRLLDLILAQDPDAASETSAAPSAKETTAAPSANRAK